MRFYMCMRNKEGTRGMNNGWSSFYKFLVIVILLIGYSGWWYTWELESLVSNNIRE